MHQMLRVLVLCAAALPAAAADWVCLGGNSRHDGLSHDVGPSAPDLLWQGTTSALFGGALYIADDRVVTMRFQSLTVAPIVCHDIATGQLLWSVDFPGANSRSVPRGVHDGRVYATNFRETQQDTIIALNLATGARVWTSPVRAPLGIVWTACFAPDGDVVLPCAGDDIARLDAGDGQPVWIAPRVIPNTGAEAICVHGTAVYGVEGSLITPKVITAWDLATGERRYSSPPLAGDGDQELPATVAADGTIYLKRDGGPLYALEDDGGRIQIRWERALDAGFYSGHIAVGLDGSVYCPDGRALVRLDPATGAELDRSAALIGTTPLNPRIAIDATGTLFVGNGGSADGRLYALSPALETLWSTPVAGMIYGGPALGAGGAVAVSGGSTTLQGFRSAATDAPVVAPQLAFELRGAPNPSPGETVVHFSLPTAGPVALDVYDIAGRAVRTLLSGAHLPAGDQAVAWDGRDAAGSPVGSGVYLVRLMSANTSRTNRVQIIR